jgi:signal transduction histidine kinase
VVVRLGADDAGLHCEVLDDGGRTAGWHPGVGIAGMRERVDQLGGTCEVGPGPRGEEVRVCLPMALAWSACSSPTTIRSSGPARTAS